MKSYESVAEFNPKAYMRIEHIPTKHRVKKSLEVIDPLHSRMVKRIKRAKPSPRLDVIPLRLRWQAAWNPKEVMYRANF